MAKKIDCDVGQPRKVGRPRKTEKEKQEYREMKAAMTPAERDEYNRKYVADRNLPSLHLSNPEMENDNRFYLANALEIFKMPAVDMTNDKQVFERIEWYFNHEGQAGIKPNITGLALALGIDRHDLRAIAYDKPFIGSYHRPARVTKQVQSLLKRCYIMLEKSWQDMVDNGKVNPAIGIFIAKNHYGYVDQQQHVVTPNVKEEQDYDSAAVMGKYLVDSDSED